MSVELREPVASAERDPELDRRERWTVARMVREPVLDAMALAGRPLGAVVLGCGEGWPVWELAELGVEWILGVDVRPAALEAARRRRAELTYDPELVRIEATEPLGIASEAFDLVVVAERAGVPAGEAEALRLAHGCTPIACIVLTSDRLRTRERARSAGFSRVVPLEPPADTTLSFILGHRAVLLARSAAQGDAHR